MDNKWFDGTNFYFGPHSIYDKTRIMGDSWRYQSDAAQLITLVLSTWSHNKPRLICLVLSKRPKVWYYKDVCLEYVDENESLPAGIHQWHSGTDVLGLSSRKTTGSGARISSQPSYVHFIFLCISRKSLQSIITSRVLPFSWATPTTTLGN